MKKIADAGSRIHALAMDLCDEADGLLNFRQGEHVPIFSGILRCLARQVQTATTNTMPLEAVAVSCRIAFECWVNLQLLLQNPRRLQDWQSERWFDEQAILKAFRRLHLPKEKALLEAQLVAVKAHIKLKRVPPPSQPEPMYQKCKRLGLAKQYEAHYALYSKCCHSTAMLCDNDPPTAYIDEFRVMTGQYAGACLKLVRAYFRRKHRTITDSALAASG